MFCKIVDAPGYFFTKRGYISISVLARFNLKIASCRLYCDESNARTTKLLSLAVAEKTAKVSFLATLNEKGNFTYSHADKK
jgi:hypothetical protein